MNQKPFLTIGTTCYNSGKYLPTLLESLRTQNVNPNLYEWLIIDNASTDDSSTVIKNLINENKDLNIRATKFETNRGPGGGRNGIFENANGTWIIMVDADDTLVPNVLQDLLNELNSSTPDLDIIEFSIVHYNWDTREEKSTLFKYNKTSIMSGRDFIQTQRFDWGPWSRAYKKDYLIRENLRFAENEILDSPDFSISAVLHANKIKYWPKDVLRYSVWEGQNSSTILGNLRLTESAYKRSQRMRKIAEDEMKINPDVAKAVLEHHHFCQLANHKYYLWHLPLKDMISLLKEYPVYLPCPSKSLTFSTKHPLTTALLLWTAKPLLSSIRYIYLKFRK